MESHQQYCSPDKRNNTSTCLEFDSLIKIANQFNKNKKNKNKIDTKTKDKELLWNSIQSNILDKSCNKDYCLLKNKDIQSINDSKIFFETFLPEHPKEWIDNPRAWLSTLDINYVLLQYQLKYPNFQYMGAVPIDFDTKLLGSCISEELCKLNLKRLLKKGINKIGVVFNLDSHDKPGSHWVSLFADLENGGVYFIDSVGMSPADEIHRLMNRIRVQGNQLLIQNDLFNDIFSRDESHSFQVKKIDSKILKITNKDKEILPQFESMILEYWSDKNQKLIRNKISKIDGSNIFLEKRVYDDCDSVNIYGFKLVNNNVTHQRKNTECGMYSIYFISKLIEGNNYYDVINNVIDDDTMNSFRELYFRPYVE